jgi:hypothetical protein
LHPPYTVWHLSYVVIGASTASTVNLRWLGETLLAFFLAMGVGAHALDELNGRPLRTRIRSHVLVGLAVVGVLAAVALGLHGMVEVSPWLGVFILLGAFLVPAYNLEWFDGAFHSNLWFALAWGAFPTLTAAFAQSGRITLAAIAASVACAGISAAQRVLSTPVRELRRLVERVEGVVTFRDGTTRSLDPGALRAAPEGALRWLSLAMPALAVGLLAARLA